MSKLPACCLHFPESSVYNQSAAFLGTHLQVSVNDVLLVTVLHR